MDKNAKIFIGIVVVLIIAVGIAVFFNLGGPATPPGPSKYEPFATCLKDKGAQFFGAFWCPHCQNQEKEFQMSRQELEKIGLYIECSLPDGQSQTKVCTDAGVKSYPTWKFKDGSELTGEIPLAQLAQKTSCVLPQ